MFRKIRKKPKFYKLFSFLLILVLLVLSFSSIPPLPPAQEVFAADINLSASANGGTVNLISITGTAGGSVGNTIDENSGTYFRSSKAGDTCCNDSRDINCIVSFTEETTFASISTVNTIEYDIYFEPVSYGGSTPYDVWGTVKDADIFIYQAGVWTQIVFNASADGSINGPWLNVEKVRVTVYTNAWNDCMSACGSGCLSGINPIAQLNELKAWGFPNPTYQDIGLRVKTPSGVVSIAAEIGAPTSPLRIAKGGVVYGVALVNPGDPNDSGIRIRVSGAIKALRKL